MLHKLKERTNIPTSKQNTQTRENDMNGFIYSVESNEVIVVIKGSNNSDIEIMAGELGFMGSDEYALAYTMEGLEETLHTDYKAA